jgi:hypothetical protein
MRRTAVTLVVAGLGAFCLAGAVAPAKAGDAPEEVRTATKRLLAADSQGPGDVHEALRRVLEIAVSLGREARLPAPVQTKLDAASAQARRLSPLDERSRAAVDDAYAAVNGGRAFVFPQAVGSIEQARAYGRAQVDRALAALAAGRSEEAVRELQGLVRLVITPMEAKP